METSDFLCENTKSLNAVDLVSLQIYWVWDVALILEILGQFYKLIFVDLSLTKLKY